METFFALMVPWIILLPLVLYIIKKTKDFKDLEILFEEYSTNCNIMKHEYIKQNRKLAEELYELKELCLHGHKTLKIERNPCCYCVVAVYNDKEFIIKMIPFQYNNKDDEEFARREAEELKEIIEKF